MSGNHPTYDTPFIPGLLGRLVPLANGGHTIVDEEDYDRVVVHKWWRAKRVNPGGVTYYVAGKVSNNQVLLHRYLFGLTTSDSVLVDHRNHDGLDNRRSANLRLCSATQNATNARKRTRKTSRYKGVCWRPRKERWQATINVSLSLRRVQIVLGSFKVEEEAAFAYEVASRMIRDPDFLCLVPIPADLQPRGERRKAIRAEVVQAIKRAYIRRPSKKDRATPYQRIRKAENGRWLAFVDDGFRTRFLSAFKTEAEAAFAHNVALERLGKPAGNRIPDSKMPAPARQQEIRGTVNARLNHLLSGGQRSINCTSNHCGVSYRKDKRRWRAYIVEGRKQCTLGHYDTEAEGALAYNVAVAVLGDPSRKMNEITEPNTTSRRRASEITTEVISRMCRDFPGVAEAVADAFGSGDHGDADAASCWVVTAPTGAAS